MSAHEKMKDQLVDFVLGELDEQQADAVRDHAAACSDCRAEIERLKVLFDCTEKLKNISADETLCVSADQSVLTLTADKNKKNKILRPSFGLKLLKGSFMKSRIAKLVGTAAVIAITMGIIGVSLHTAQPAWAIEQTIQALENKDVKTLKVTAEFTGGSNLFINSDEKTKETYQGVCTVWAKPHIYKMESREIRLEMPGFMELVVQSNNSQNYDTYVYDVRKNIVHYYPNNIGVVINPWIGNNFFSMLKEMAENWNEQYEFDQKTGQEVVCVRCTLKNERIERAWWFQINLGTNLPIRFKQWTNVNFEGQPQFDVQTIEYNPELPEGIFDFVIPEGATVITQVGENQKEKEKIVSALADPANGMAVSDLSHEEACDQITRTYWQAVIDKDWETVYHLRPTISLEKWKNDNPLYGNNPPVEILEIGKPYQQEGCSMGPIIPCKIQYANGKIRDVSLIVMFRENEGKESCLIAGTWDSETY
jgi:hypothetical protein